MLKKRDEIKLTAMLRYYGTWKSMERSNTTDLTTQSKRKMQGNGILLMS